MAKKEKVKKVKKKKWYILLSILMIITFWLVYTNTNVKVTNLEIKSGNIPKSFDGFKIAHVSDLHSKDWKEKLTDSIKNNEPDIIVVTGDLIDSSDLNFDNALNFIKEGQKICPIYFVSGNHEAWNGKYHILKNELIKEGVTVLDNEKAFLTKGKDKILLLGLKDPDFMETNESFSRNIASESIVNEIKEIKEDYKEYKILLSHRPELFDEYLEGGVDLILSGHAHGGQFRIPFVGGVVAPNQGLFPEFTSGIYRKEKSQMVVSRGLGNSIIKVRVNNMPELIIVELKN